ncbi:MAG: hypothetical protein AAF944_09705 [Bacteroidota bacterium]
MKLKINNLTTFRNYVKAETWILSSLAIQHKLLHEAFYVDLYMFSHSNPFFHE